MGGGDGHKGLLQSLTFVSELGWVHVCVHAYVCSGLGVRAFGKPHGMFQRCRKEGQTLRPSFVPLAEEHPGVTRPGRSAGPAE